MRKIILILGLSILFVNCETKKTSVPETANNPTNVEIINGIYSSLENGDFDGFLESLDEKIIWNEAENHPYDDGNPYIGHQAITELFARLGEWDNFSVDSLNTYDMANDMVLITGRYTGSFKKTGKSISAQVAHLWTLKSNKVIEFQQYTDTKQFKNAMME
jgi:ketosteroid isomerase-like protein